MKKLFIIIIILLAIPLASFAQTEKESFTYFYADWCPHCQKVNDFFKKNGVYEKYNVEKLNFDELKNKIKLKNIFEEKEYGGKGGIPAIIYGDKLLVGDTPIIDFFKKELEKFPKEENPAAEKSGENGVALLALIGAALADAINPCAFAVLILLLAAIIRTEGKKRALLAGLFFTGAVFVSYLMMGLGVYKAITIFNLPRVISLLVGILAIIIGLANLKDAFWHGKIFLMEVPMNWRPKMKAILNRVTTPWGAASAGFLVSLFLLPCTSGPYVVILGLLAERVALMKTISLLVLYNIIFVLPMILITFGMYFGLRLGKLEEWRQKNIQSLHVIAGSIMLLLGIYLIYSRV